MRFVRIIITSSIVIYSFSAITAQAAIYKCVSDEKGIYYIDKPCPVVDIETKLNAVKDPKNGYVPSGFNKDEEAKVASKGIVVGRENSGGIESSKAMDDQSEGGNSLLKAESKNSGGGAIMDSVKQGGSDIVSKSSANKKLDTSLIGNVGPNGNEPHNVDELASKQGGPKD